MTKFLQLILAVALGSPITLFAANYQITEGSLKYAINTTTKEAEVMQCVKPSQTSGITIPDDLLFEDGKTYKVTAIWSGAFEKCKLKSVHFPVALKTIGASAFANCPNLFKGKEMTLPDKLTTIEMEAFYGCKFTSVILPSALTKIGEGAFQNTTLTDVRFSKPKNSLTIDFRAFRACKKLTSISIPSGTTKLGQAVFADCTALTSVSIPATVKTVPSMGFQDCTALKNVSLASGITKIAFQAFTGAGIESLEIPSTVTTIEQNAFSGSKIRSISLPYGLKSISYCLFAGCNNLLGIAIPATVTNIASGAFYECASLASVFIPSSVKRIEQAAFYGCDQLMLVKSDAITPAVCEGTVWGDPTLERAQLQIPETALYNYRNADGWQDFRWLYSSGIEVIKEDILTQTPIYYDMKGITYTEIPSHPGIYVKVTGANREKIIIK